MLIQTRTFVVRKGHAEQVVERFSRPGMVDKQPGLLDISVMVNRKSGNTEEVIVLIRWASEAAWKNWEKSPEHIAGHRSNKGQTPPDYIVSSTVQMYNVRALRKGL